MKSKIVLKQLVFSLLILCINSVTKDLIAQDFSHRIGTGIFTGAVKMVGGQIDRSTIDQWAGVQLSYGLSPSLLLNANFAYGWVYPKDPQGSHFKSTGGYKTILIPSNLNLTYNFLPQATVRPFILLGAGVTNWDVRKLSGDISIFSTGESVSGSQFDATLVAGFGVEFVVAKDYALSATVNYHRLLKGNEDTIGFGDDGNDAVAEMRLGISYFLPDNRDQDGDGILDRFDMDPLKKEDMDGFQDDDGAPDYDNDNDGIPDEQDKAPNEPEDIDGFMDEDGIPDLDNDGDTILDVDDKCPNMPEDFDNFEDQDGCPDYDNDKDSIPDSLDECPNWPEDVNGYLDEDGCPDEKPEPEPEAIEKGKNIILKGVNFTSGSAELTPESFAVLEEILKTLIAYPKMEIEIRGYTDNTGSFDANQLLSERRAYAVKKYLTDRGINPSRLRAVGYGELHPIADNSTKEGRAMNRRIEFVRIK